MKKIVNYLIIFLMIISSFILFGCGERYDNLGMSLSFVYEKNQTTQQLDDGTVRVTNGISVFDKKIDGSYIFYIEKNKTSNVFLDVTYNNVPKDFNYGIALSSANVDVANCSKVFQSIQNGTRTSIVFTQKGQTELEVKSSESNKSKKVYIEVVELAKDISFTYDNFAMAKIEDSTLDFRGKINNVPYNLSNVDLEFGVGTGETFVAYDTNQLRTLGFTFEEWTKQLVLYTTNTDVRTLTVKATYNSPIGEEVVAFTNISVLANIENFEIYHASSIEQAKEENLLTEEKAVDMVLNMIDLNTIDLILKVKSNGEYVNFNLNYNINNPIEIVPNSERVFYTNADNELVDDFADSVYTYKLIKITATNTTEETSKYPNKIAKLSFSCNYQNYRVENYPINTDVFVKIYTLVSSFSINNQKMLGLSFSSSNLAQVIAEYSHSFYKSDIYLNSSNDVEGEKFAIDVAEPITISRENAKFTLEFYNAYLTKIDSPLDKFEITLERNNNHQKLESTNFSSLVFEKNDIFYIKPKTGVVKDDLFYMVVKAQKPTENATVAFCILTARQGLSEITDFDYSYSKFKIDGNGDYVLDENNQKVVEQINVDNVDFVAENGKYIATQDINLDYDVPNQQARLEFFYTPVDAVLNNVRIYSSNQNIIEITKDEEANSFSFVPKNIGNTQIIISASNLSIEYIINVNVYKSISAFYITLNSNQGVGSSEVDTDGITIKSAVVEIGSSFSFSFIVQPNIQIYQVDYELYLDGETRQLLGQTSCQYNGIETKIVGGISSGLLSDVSHFGFDAKTKAFSFFDSEAVERTYVLVAKIVNFNGAIERKEITLNCFSPINQISAKSSRAFVFDANNLYYQNKVTAYDTLNSDVIANDESVFGLKVNTYGKGEQKPTYDFDNYGQIEIFIGNQLECRYLVDNYILIPDFQSSNCRITLLSDGLIGEMYYFRLNENYVYQYTSALKGITIVVTAGYGNLIKQSAINIGILKTNQSSDMQLSEIENNEINFRQGIDSFAEFNLTLIGDKLKNDAIMTRIIGLIEVSGNQYYISLDDEFVFKVSSELIRENEYKILFQTNNFVVNCAYLAIINQDRINNQTQYEDWNNFDYVRVDIQSEDFCEGIFYVYQTGKYIVANAFDETKTYFLKTVNVDKINNVWQNNLVINITISDGINVPYHISSVKELLEVGVSGDSVTKKYILTRDIDLSNVNFEAISAYYQSNLTAEDYIPNYYYIYQGDKFIKDSTGVFDVATTYYDYGFNGEFSGKFETTDLKTGITTARYYKLYNLKYEGKIYDYGGVFARVGKQGKISDLQVDYKFYNPNFVLRSGETVADMTTASVGGIAGENCGEIINCSVNFESINIWTSRHLNFGGIAGKNVGAFAKIVSNNSSNFASSVNGQINVNVGLISTEIIDNKNIFVGGVTGYNEGYICGKYDTSKSIEYSFDEMGYDLNIDIIVIYVDSVDSSSKTSAVGGVVGYNDGFVENYSTSGKIRTAKSYNVGGLVGYNVNITSEFDYSLKNSYSTMAIAGYNNVGGAIGYCEGKDSANKIKIEGISSENYSNLYKKSRTLISGSENVGGLVGYTKNVELINSYFASYYYCTNIEDEAKYSNTSNYDIVGTASVGGLIGYANYTNVRVCATYCNVYNSRRTSVSIFIASEDSKSSAESCFGIGNIYSSSTTAITNPKLSTSNSNSYSVVYYKGSTFINGSKSNTVDNIVVSGDNWERDANVNSNLPYLVVGGNALFATLPITVSCNVIENVDYNTYIKNDDKSVVLLLAVDEYNKYTPSQINKLNTISLLDFLDINIFALTHKTAVLSAESSDKSVATIKNGVITLLKEGRTTITIYSKISSENYQTIDVVVMAGFSKTNLYANSSLTLEVNNQTISTLKSKTLAMYLETEFEKEKDGVVYNLKSNSKNVGLRFLIQNDENLAEVLDDLNNGSTDYSLQDILKINNIPSWDADAGRNFFYVDVTDASSVFLSANIAISKPLNISVIPFIKKEFNLGFSQIILDRFETKTFSLIINNGCQDIVIENNLSPNVEINQLENFTFTITIYTDFEDDALLNNFESIASEDSNFMSSIGTPVYKRDSDDTLKSISVTYTVWYKNKMTAIENRVYYQLKFFPKSNPIADNTLTINLCVVPQDGINDIAYRIYSDYKSDYPQSPSINNVVYNGRTALLSMEVYPFFANYSKIKISYRSSTSYPLTLSQLKYDASGSGEKFSYYGDSGAYIDETGALVVEKYSGQDTYQVNTGGIYSYSKSYFFGILVSSDVADRTNYVITVQILDKTNKIILTKNITFITLSKTSIQMSFDSRLKGEDNIYYLPVNTTQRLDLTITNKYNNMLWSVSSSDYVMSSSDKELFIPKYENGSYYVQVMDYENNKFSTDLIGKSITLTLLLDNGEVSDPASITFVISLFTVTNIDAKDVSNGYMTFENLTTTPLFVRVSAIYDTSLDSDSNWYQDWYEENKINEEDNLHKLLKNAGYEVSSTFGEIIGQLEQSIAQARYSSTSASVETISSGVWLYINNDLVLEPLKSNTDYNGNTFGVQMYNNYFAVHGYLAENSSDMRLYVRLSYSHYNARENKIDCNGIPNVRDYNYDRALFASVFTFGKDFILNFISNMEINNYIPISNEKEFLELSTYGEGNDYRLVNDIVLSSYTPFDAKFNSFDGNNYKIYITSFSEEFLSGDNISLGLFSSLNQNCMVFNTTVYYTNKVDYSSSGNITPRATPLSLTVKKTSNVVFGGLIAQNNGIITNCSVSGGINFSIDDPTSPTNINNILIGLMVGNNNETGFVTNSRVHSLNIICYGRIGGFVGQNNGKIVASYFDNSQINNLSDSNIGGFVWRNNGKINECYIQGARANNDQDIRNTGSSISSYGGEIGGFVYYNNAEINDCYSNILISSSKAMAGFIYVDTQSSVISRCYSISYKKAGDNNSTAFPFLGKPSPYFSTSKIIVQGVLNNCYFLEGGINWTDKNFYASADSETYLTPNNKKAVGLSFDNFATHDSFVNFDMSLVYNTTRYPNNRDTYNYVDGYTWVIIEGKPVLVSTLVLTISQQDYIGKRKTYLSQEETYFDVSSLGELKQEVQDLTGKDSGTKKTSYYQVNRDGTYSESDLIYSTFDKQTDKTSGTLTYEFQPLGGRDMLSVVCSYQEVGGKKVFDYVSAQLGQDNPKILDIKIFRENEYVDSDSNFRANDTIFVTADENGLITKIIYKTLASASYAYNDMVANVSAKLGERLNPKIIKDYRSFCYYLGNKTDLKGEFFRLVSDIDLDYNFVPTSKSNFVGVLQGNYMEIQNLSISYYSETLSEGDPISFGLFSKITTETSHDAGVYYGQYKDTVISNVNIIVDQVLSNAHSYVGALAGQIEAEVGSRKVFLNNISINSKQNKHSFVMGKNATGGLAGYVHGYAIIKDISSNVCVSATYNEISTQDMLYIDYGNNTRRFYSYAGGVVGIFDCYRVIDIATQKNFNASNISVYGENVYIGNIVGTAFGLIGESTIVNYVNCYVTDSENSFIKSTSYGGGIVGENRGILQSSSINYDTPNYQVSKVGEALKVQNNFFYESSKTPTVAIGGLVGLNNGGFVSNSISNIKVCNKFATIAGGAIGRIVEGGLKNVVATGSVLSMRFIGGLVGSINDKYTMISNNTAVYKEQAIKGINNNNYNIVFGSTRTFDQKIVISNCVAGNNYLAKDYTYYMDLIVNQTRNPGMMGGFVGIITLQNNDNLGDYVLYSGVSYYNNTLYSVVNGSEPAYYLNAVNFSSTFDYVGSGEANANLGSRTILTDESNQQVVYPYSSSEFYYESQLPNCTYQITSSRNPYVKQEAEVGFFADKIYIINSSTPASLANDDQFFTEITNTEEMWSLPYNQRTFEEYKNRFGRFYYKNEQNLYTLVATEEQYSTLISDPDNIPTFYFISSPTINNFSFTKSYNTDQDQIIFYGNDSSEYGYIFTELDNLETKCNYVVINGIRLDIGEKSWTEEYDELDSLVSKSYEIDVNLTLPNGGIIQKFNFDIKKIIVGENVLFEAHNFVLTYSYNVSSSRHINLLSSSNNAITTYSLYISSKEVIYNSFDNGYWSLGNNFYSKTFENADITPTNLEYSEKYIWSTFATDISKDGNTISIGSAGELAYLSNIVNNGTFESEIIPSGTITIQLTSDIDLSGKYWVPIGNSNSNVFGSDSYKIIFDGKGHNIKYVSVNQNSNSGNMPNYAGLFGKVKNVEIRNINILGGEVNGNIVGGLVGQATNSKLYNITNRNNSVGCEYVGGIVGYAVDTVIYNCQNYASVQNDNSSLYKENVYVGGIVGYLSSTTSKNLSDSVSFDSSASYNFGFMTEEDGIVNEYPNINKGEVVANNSTNNYIGTSRLVNLHIGGLIGYANKIYFVASNANIGKISTKNNAHNVYLGGAVGEIDTCFNVQNLTNEGDINIVSENICSSVAGFEDNTENYSNENIAKFDIGGVIGLSNSPMSKVSNLSNITLQGGTSYSNFAFGGIVGRLTLDNISLNINQSYNIGQLSLQSYANSIYGIGGIVGVVSKYNDNSVLVSIEDCYNSGKIHSTSDCKTFVGGILGYVASNKTETIVLISRCLNVGELTIYDIKKSINGLGAIVGNIAKCYTKTADNGNLYNFYLASSAFSGSEIFGGYTSFESNNYEIKDNITFAQSKISKNLKDMQTYMLQSEDSTEVEYIWDFENVWIQEYDTWYPTLKQNRTNSYWVNYQERLDRSAGVYSISSAEELSYIANEINSGKIDTTGVTFTLRNYIDLSNKYFTPIGTRANPFKGTFDGDHYVVKNLTVDGASKIINTDKTQSYLSDYGALFGYCENASIINIGVESPNVREVQIASAIVAQANNSRLVNLFTEKGESELSIVRGLETAGGICGVLENSNDNTSSFKTGLYFSYNNVSVSATSQEGLCYVGGLVGKMQNSYISNCYNNSKGIVVVRSQTVNGISSSVIAGNIDKDCRIQNVFNIAGYYQSKDKPDETFSVDPAMFIIRQDDTGKIGLGELNRQPTFDNLDESAEGKKEDIWTRDYSLNEKSEYPSLRSLSKDWKNTQSEALSAYDVTQLNFSNVKNSILNLNDTKYPRYDNDGNLMANSMYGLVNFANENFNVIDNTSSTELKIQKIYLISSVEDLVWIANSINNGNLKTKNCEFILLQDLDLSGRYWTPIGVSATYAFAGVFNFNGHVISGLTIDYDNFVYAGFFGYTKNAYIVNGYLDKCFIKINNQFVNTQTYVGSLVGYAEDTNIRNIVVTTNLLVTSKSSAYVGGIAGFIKNIVETKIDNVRVYPNSTGVYLGKYKEQVIEFVNESGGSSGEILENSINIGAFSDTDRIYVGGIVGYIVDAQREEINLSKSINNAYCKANVAGVSLSSSSNVYVGGIVGYGQQNVSISSSKMEGYLKSYSFKFDVVGGIVGYISNGIVDNCQFDGYIESRQASGRNITIDQNIRSYLGGIIGLCDESIIANCYMSGRTVAVSSDQDITVGGLIGYARYKNIDQDGICVYKNSSNGFEGASAVGLFYPSDHNMDVSSKYSTDDSLIAGKNGFADTLWKDKKLISNKIFVVGSGNESFYAIDQEKELLNNTSVDMDPGVYLSDLSLLRLQNKSEAGAKYGLSVVTVVDGKLKYYYTEHDLPDATSVDFYISDVLPECEKIIACYITYIAPKK